MWPLTQVWLYVISVWHAVLDGWFRRSRSPSNLTKWASRRMACRTDRRMTAEPDKPVLVAAFGCSEDSAEVCFVGLQKGTAVLIHVSILAIHCNWSWKPVKYVYFVLKAICKYDKSVPNSLFVFGSKLP